MSHFKLKTFSALQYAQQSTKRVSKKATKYCTHLSSYYPVPQAGMLLADSNFMAPLPFETLPKNDEDAMRDWLDSYTAQWGKGP